MIIFHDGALAEIPQIVNQTEASRILLVVDPNAYKASGAAEIMEPLLAGIAVQRFSDFEVNPKVEDVERGLRLIDDQKPDLVVAFGGGTAIDIAKLVACFTQQEHSAKDIIVGGQTITEAALPILAIPTTAGTGSEATHFAVVYVDGRKYSVAHPSLRPEYVILDPTLMATLPKAITAATGLDAFCQAVESMWAVGATEESISDAEKAIPLAATHLESAVNGPTPEARRAMCEASHLAGRAINISKTTASHALSYALTSRHGIPHGIAVATTLAPMLAFNSEVTDDDCNDPRGLNHVRQQISKIIKLLGASSVSDACEWIENLLRKIDCTVSVADAGITGEADLLAIAESVNVERLGNNPRRADREALLKILQGGSDGQNGTS